MGRLRINISILIVIAFVLFVAFASLRMRNWLGIKLVVCIALGLNFASLIVIATDLDSRIRISALAYFVGGCGWILMVCFVPSTDALFQSYLITPGLIKWIVPGPNPEAPRPDPAFILLHSLSHSLISIVAGSIGAFAAWKLGTRFFDPDRSTTQTSDPS
jgi:hypothetical protein